MSRNSGVTVSYKQDENGLRGMFVSGFFSSVDVIPSGCGVMLEVSCWGNDSSYGMGRETYAILDGDMFIRGDPETDIPQRDLHYLRIALEKLESVSPEEEPYASLRTRVVEALKPVVLH